MEAASFVATHGDFLAFYGVAGRLPSFTARWHTATGQPLPEFGLGEAGAHAWFRYFLDRPRRARMLRLVAVHEDLHPVELSPALLERLAAEAEFSSELQPEELALLHGSPANAYVPPQPYGAPAHPLKFVPRQAEYEQLVKLLLDENNAAAVGVIALEGRGGVGKSLLAAEVIRDERVRRRYPDGIAWVELGSEVRGDSELAGRQETLAKSFSSQQDLRVGSVQEGLNVLHRHLARRRCLLVLDDVWHPEQARAFHVRGAPRLLFTSRNHKLASFAMPVVAIDLGVLDEPQAEELLFRASGVDYNVEPRIRSKVLKVLGGLPLAILQIGKGVAGHPQPWSYALELLDGGDVLDNESTDLTPGYATVRASVLASLKVLDKKQPRAHGWRPLLLDFGVSTPTRPAAPRPAISPPARPWIRAELKTILGELIAAGASPIARDDDGCTPLQLAELRNLPLVVDALRAAMAEKRGPEDELPGSGDPPVMGIH